jgi:hypothetical protein
MHVDSIIRDVSLLKCCSEAIRELGTLTSLQKHKVSLCKLNAYFEEFGIDLEYSVKDNVRIYTLSQINFFKLSDFMALIRINTTELESYYLYGPWDRGQSTWVPQDFDYPSRLHFDPYDVQPFRQHLFDSNRATLELFSILLDLGFSDTDVKINNYENVIEFDGDCIERLIEVLCIWVEHFESIQESLMTQEVHYANIGIRY